MAQKKFFQVRVDADLHTTFKAFCAANNTDMSSVVVEIIKRVLDNAAQADPQKLVKVVEE